MDASSWYPSSRELYHLDISNIHGFLWHQKVETLQLISTLLRKRQVCRDLLPASRVQLDDISDGDVASTDRFDPLLWRQPGDRRLIEF